MSSRLLIWKPLPELAVSWLTLMATGPYRFMLTPLVVGLPRMMVPLMPPPLLRSDRVPPTRLTSPVVA